MENRPHSRDKKVSGGSASVGKGQKIGTSGKVGGTSRPSSAPQTSHQQTQSHTTPTGGSYTNTNYTVHQQSYNTANTGANTTGGVQRAASRGLLGGGGLKSIIVIVLIIAAAAFLLKNCGGITSGNNGGILDDLGDSIGLDSLSNISGLIGSSGWTEGISTSPEYTDETPDVSVASNARGKYVKPIGGGNDTVTVMVYMCGTDLESKYGMATSDLKEMMSANLSDKVNIIVETGGCKQWKTNGISNSVNQIYKVQKGSMVRLEPDFGKAAMTDPTNLTKFVNYCADNYEASRYFLILWDHGGGSLTGYGYDEKNSGSSSMTLTKINSALAGTDVKFDFIGFDACLMSTLETALVCNEYADYMIASEEVEPGTGWYYTTWLKELSKNTSISTVSLAKSIIDSYVSSCRGSAVTLAVTDLAELQGTVPNTFRSFSTSTSALIENDDYKIVSNARANTRQFSAESRINQVDLCDLATRIGTKEGKNLTKAIQGCVKYNGSTISGANGLSIYFPYETMSSMNSAVSVYNSLGMDSEYIKCIKSFASLGTAGQTAASSSLFGGGGGDLGSLLSLVGGGQTSSSASPLSSLLGGVLGSGTSSSSSSSSYSAGSSLDASTVLSLLSAFSGRSMPNELSWVDNDLIAASAQSVADNYIDPARITVVKKGGQNVLDLYEQEWELIQTVELNVFVDDGDGFIDLGCDNVAEYNSDGDLIVDYDGTWISVNGNVAAYYLVSDTENGNGTYTTVGRIPAYLNGQLVNIKVIFDSKHPYGVITGASPLYTGSETETSPKGDLPIRKGDSIQFVCDYYEYDGKFDSAYTLGDKFTVPASGLEIYNVELEDTVCSVSYKLTDIYGNVYWTPAIEY